MRPATRRHQELLTGREAQRQRHGTPRVATLPPPVGGLNTRDAWSDMDQADAIELVNWWPGYGRCAVRKGTRLHATLEGIADPVETLAEFHSGTRKLIAAAGGKLWNVTTGGTIEAAAALATGFSNDRWQHVMMNGSLGLVNGEDPPQVYTGSTVSAMTVSGPTVASLIGINVFKSRSYFWQANNRSFWYSAIHTLGGALTEFPLGEVTKGGGSLVAMTTWTRDGGAGVDDLAVFLMSSGEVLVYQGADPGSADDWALVGVFHIGQPLGIRAIAKVGGDVLLATSDGYSLLSNALRELRGARGTQISDKIRGAAALTTGAAGFGWQLLLYPRGQRLLVNHPVGSTFEQHVVNIGTGAWTRFTGMPASCWSLFDEAPYFGGPGGKVYEADTGVTDNGADVVAEARQSYGWLGDRGRTKLVTAAHPIFDAENDVNFRFGIGTDFDLNLPDLIARSFGAAADPGGAWDTAEWGTASWAARERTTHAWFAHGARGYAFSVALRVAQRSSPISWLATMIAYTPAAPGIR